MFQSCPVKSIGHRLRLPFAKDRQAVPQGGEAVLVPRQLLMCTENQQAIIMQHRVNARGGMPLQPGIEIGER